MDHRARLHLQAASKAYPGAWKRYDAFRQDREALGGWPDYVYCPLAGAYAIISGGGNNRVPLHLVGDIGRLSAMAAWRPTQGIYRFDPDLYAALWSSPISGDLPCDLLRYLPAWCVYVETGPIQKAEGFHGFFAHIEYDPNDGREELRLVLDMEDALTPFPLHLGPWDLATALNETGRVARSNAVELGQPAPGNLAALAVHFEPLVSLLLYLCSDGADYERRELPRPKRTKQGWRLFPADKPTTWDVGARIGAAIRAVPSQGGPGETAETEGRARPRPHVRSAHWHSFWRGPLDGERSRMVKWLPPMLVNAEDLGQLAVTVRPVR